MSLLSCKSGSSDTATWGGRSAMSAPEAMFLALKRSGDLTSRVTVTSIGS